MQNVKISHAFNFREFIKFWTLKTRECCWHSYS